MAKRSNQKLRLLYILKILTEQTDEMNAITLARLSEELSKYGIVAERKTLYDDIEELRLFGADICVKRDRYVRYYIGKRDISAAELKIFSHAISSSEMLGEREKRKALRTLVKMTGRASLPLAAQSLGEVESLSHPLPISDTLDTLCRAIISDKMIRVKCFEWNSQKQRILRFDGKSLLLSPWHLELSPQPVLIAYDNVEKRFFALRADRFIEVNIVDHVREGEREFAELYESAALESMLDIPSSTIVRLRCSNEIADDVVGRYGSAITVLQNGYDSFECSIKIVPEEQFFSWVFFSGSKIQIISPEGVAERYKRLLRDAWPNAES